jgi:hypothetical protein
MKYGIVEMKTFVDRRRQGRSSRKGGRPLRIAAAVKKKPLFGPTTRDERREAKKKQR